MAMNEKGSHKTDKKQPTNEQPAKVRILVINDTQEILEAFRDILEEEGYEVLLYSFAVTGIEDIERVRPDLIILDYIFGGERLGWQILQLLKMHRSTAGIPVIVCTAATRDVREITGYLTAHDIQLVAKPFDIDDLLNAVKQALINATRSVDLVLDRLDENKRPDGE
ncbi:MAG TPA: response regulator [Ktedonobacterales bacterium]|jgi:DNA-binding response OmpR family regulator|nr:response regulator [Ktedonobacterales bacterium]